MRFLLRILALVFLGIVSFSHAATAQTPPPSSPPSPTQKPDSSAFPKEAIVIEDLLVRVRQENDGTSVRETTLRAKIQ
jgi:hypothetical protein